jgi:hypothetical protein
VDATARVAGSPGVRQGQCRPRPGQSGERSKAGALPETHRDRWQPERNNSPLRLRHNADRGRGRGACAPPVRGAHPRGGAPSPSAPLFYSHLHRYTGILLRFGMAGPATTPPDYVAKALECELRAARTKAGPEVAKAWRQIADSYRFLARVAAPSSAASGFPSQSSLPPRADPRTKFPLENPPSD